MAPRKKKVVSERAPAWHDTLKADDKVAIRDLSTGRCVSGVVVRLTPTRDIVVQSPRWQYVVTFSGDTGLYSNDALRREFQLIEYTDEIAVEIERSALVHELSGALDLDALPVEMLRQIKKMITAGQ